MEPTVAMARSLRRVHDGLINCLDGNDIAECRVEVGETCHDGGPH
jgi:hypothetical protein